MPRPGYRDLIAEMAVDVPEGTLGTVAVERFEVPAHSIENVRLAMQGRRCQPGTYTRLMRRGQLWMSDTTAERRDHLAPAAQIAGWGAAPAESVLIGGLGLGCILRVALLTPTVRRVDVVEIDEDVIGLVAPHYEKMAADAGVDLTIHHADVYAIRWPAGTRWDVAWFDVWGDISPDDLATMSKLRRSYGRRTGWCDCWGRVDMLRQRRAEANAPWNR